LKEVESDPTFDGTSTMAARVTEFLFLLSALVPTTNISYYTVPAAWILCFAPHVYAIKHYDALNEAGASASDSEKKSRKFNGTSPRTFLTTVDAHPRLPKEKKDELVRAEGAHQNGLENLGWFAAAVVAANSAGVDVWWCNAMSLGYLANRLVYNLLYVKGAKGPVRGMPFYASTA
jgi:uncharacterized MAPEG superfamily protein